MSDASHPRILLVDDDPVILRLLEVNFRIDGFEVDSASRGEEALEKAAANPPDAVVLDVMMPGLDGWEVCERLRANPSLAGIPVVFLSARVRDEDRTRGEALGIADYVSKPFDPTDLVELVRRHLAGERP